MKRMILLMAAAAGLMGVGSVTLPGATAASGTTYRAPYSAGPATTSDDDGGGEFSYVNADPATGKVDVFSLNVVPGAIGCAATGAMGYLRVEHPVTTSLTGVLAAYSGASMTPYSWLKMNVRGFVNGAEQYLGSVSVRGQKVGESGTLIAPLDKSPDIGSVLTIDFGVESGSACPHGDGATVTYSTIAVY